jgi:hypothetical protein
MKKLGITLTIIILAANAHAQTGDTIVTKIKWIRNLPAPVRTGWRNCKYLSWKIFGIKKLVTSGDTLYTIDVALFQSLGPDDADIAEEDVLYFSSAGQLVRIKRL